MGVKHGLLKYRRNADSEQHLDITTMKYHYEGKLHRKQATATEDFDVHISYL